MFIKHSSYFLFFVLSMITNMATATESGYHKALLGEQKLIQSVVLNQQRSFFVRLPENYYNSDRHYPVVYLLDANSFYAGNIYQEAVALMTKLEKLDEIPELILVGIQSEQWYQDVVTRPNKFENYIAHEVATHIRNSYRTLPTQILAGHSYAGAFVSGAVPVKDKNFDLLLSISPIYPSMEYIERITNRYSAVKQHSIELVIVDGDESPMDKQILKQSANVLNRDLINFSYHSKALDGHMSVLSSGLSHGLKEFFSDFRFPSRKMTKTNLYTIESLHAYYKNRDAKYGTKTDEERLKSLAITMAQRYTSMSKIKQALPFWRAGKSKFKEYFMSGYVDRFVHLDKPQLALELLAEMQELFPESEKNYAEKINILSAETK